MIDLDIAGIVQAIQAWPIELTWIVLLLLCFGGVVMMGAIFGAAGLYTVIVVCIIGANVQVLKVVETSVFPDPVGLGTIVFATTYLCTDILAEHFGRRAALKGVFLGFAAYLLWTLLMVITLGFTPLDAETVPVGYAWALPVQGALETLFLPAPQFFLAGMAAYLISQVNDVWLFGFIRRLTAGRQLWLRNTASTSVSALIDNTVFSLLAWIVLAPEPLAFSTVVVTYIVGTYVLRLMVAVLDTPFIYLAGKFVRTSH